MLKKMMIALAMLTSPLHGENYDLSCPDYPTYDDTEGCPVPYEAYPGIAYEHSFTTTQLAVAVVVSVIFFTIVAVALTNTPCGHHCHGNCHSD